MSNEEITRQFELVYRFNGDLGRACAMTFTNNDNISSAKDGELYRIFMIWAKTNTHQRVSDSPFKKRIVRAMKGDKAAGRWLKAKLAAFFIRHHQVMDARASNTLVIDDLVGEKLKEYSKGIEDDVERWAVSKRGVLTFTTPNRVALVQH